MKSFVDFRFICEKLNKTHDEDSQSKLWNYFIANSKNTKVRDLILDGEIEKAEEEIKKEVEKAKGDSKHPLNFKNAGDEEFAKATGRQSSDEEPYNNFLDDSVSGLMALAGQKKLKSAVEKGLPTRVTGSGTAELSKKFKSAGGVDRTPKGDLEVYDPDNSKYRVGISMKKGAGAQLASAEGGELKGMYSVAARNYVKRFHSDKSKEERKKIEKEIMNDVERVSAINRLQKTSGEAPEPDKQKGKLRDSGQGILDKLHDKYPQLTRSVSQVATSGKGKFETGKGTAGVVLTGKNKDKEATASASELQRSERPRNAKPKGRGRPGNVKIDYKPLMNSKGQEVKRQHAATFRQNNPDDPAVVHNKKSDALKQMQARAAQQQQPEPQQKTEPTPAPTPEPQAQEKPVDTRPPSEKKKEKKQEPVTMEQE